VRHEFRSAVLAERVAFIRAAGDRRADWAELLAFTVAPGRALFRPAERPAFQSSDRPFDGRHNERWAFSVVPAAIE